MPSNPEKFDFEIPEFATSDLPPVIKIGSIAGLVAVIAITAISSLIVAANTSVSSADSEEEMAIVEEVITEPPPAPEPATATPETVTSPAPDTPVSTAPATTTMPTETASPAPESEMEAVTTPASSESEAETVTTPASSESEPVAASPEPATEPSPTATAITDSAQIALLQQKLEEQIDATWQNPVPGELEYKVTVDETGAIGKYTPINPAAQEYGNQSPLVSLVKADSPVAAETPQAPFAEFQVIFTPGGNLLIQPQQ